MVLFIRYSTENQLKTEIKDLKFTVEHQTSRIKDLNAQIAQQQRDLHMTTISEQQLKKTVERLRQANEKLKETKQEDETVKEKL